MTRGEIEINIPQESMAQMTAMTPFTVSRVLSKWEQQGVVSVRRGRIAVRSYEGLLRMCQRSKVPSDLGAAPGNGTTMTPAASRPTPPLELAARLQGRTVRIGTRKRLDH